MILYVDSTIRNNSRTKKLADYLVEKLNDEVKYVKLEDEFIAPLNNLVLCKRSDDIINNDFSDNYFDYAIDFAKADIIVMVSPYYDFSFSSLLKIYIENITIEDITFRYDNGIPIGLCKAKKLYYVTTSGGPYVPNYSYNYIEEVARSLYGIQEIHLIKAENLDVYSDKKEEILQKAYQDIDELVK